MAAAASPAVTPHQPVLLSEVMAALQPRDGGIYVDGTFGGGGYSRALLEAADCTVWAIDRDPDAIEAGAALKKLHPGRLHLIEGRFGDMAALLRAHGIEKVEGIVLDLGVSSMQLDRPERGFSFRFDAPLDMRMEKRGQSAADLVNALDESALANILFTFGEEKKARRIARAIALARTQGPITTTGQLAGIVRAAVPQGGARIDPATRTFQALRIAINDELGEIDRALEAAESLLAAGGRLAVVSFHSLEDRRVKQFMRARAGRLPGVSRHLPRAANSDRATLRLIAPNGIAPSAAETTHNPRARSARLRIAERMDGDAKQARPAGDAA